MDSGALSVDSKIDRVGFGCLEAVQAVRYDDLVMRTQRKTQIGKVQIANLESFRVQVSIRFLGISRVFLHTILIPLQRSQNAKAGRAPAGKI